jgi:hypothetical protein
MPAGGEVAVGVTCKLQNLWVVEMLGGSSRHGAM